MSLDLRGLNLEAMARPDPATIPEQMNPGPTDGTTSLPSPRTPHRTLRQQSPPRPPQSPTKAPTEQEIKDLQEHINSVYGSYGQVFINILPTPVATPQKPAQLPSHEHCDPAPLPPNFTDLADINLQPTSSAMTFNFDNPDIDMGYESSSYYTSDALSPSPISSPRQKSMQSFLDNIPELPIQENIAELPAHDLAFSQAPMFPASSASMSMNGLPSTALARSPLLSELEVDASLEYTGISPEEVQRYISEQDPTTNKWTCLYPECGKIFGRRENIRSHVQTHLGDRQYKCNGCGKKFVRQHDLKRHAKIHTGNKPYKCPCGAGFARQDALTRHRQRGMCIGGFENAVRKQAKRGRPKKNRPELEQRVEKANKTRRALASAASSISAGSPASDPCSSPPAFDDVLQAQPMSRILSETASFDDPMSSTVDHYSFESESSPYIEEPNMTTPSFASSSSYTGDATSIALLQQFSQHTHTPPMSPANYRPHSSGSVSNGKAPVYSSPLKGSSTPSRASTQSNPFTTPPTSPVEPKDELEELFELPDNSCSQFELEMKAMGDFTSLDASTYDFLDFTV
ncbi:Metallothionein expression activator [Kalmusia sp. IMI 367209]|nr:Metallothionein expression activator [Kalmusia sp. IMI 367209]